jgi:hypothetical protein
MNLTDKQLEDLHFMHTISGVDGTWNYSDYTQGLYNGLEMALAIVENREPVFKESPEVWLIDTEIEPENKLSELSA